MKFYLAIYLYRKREKSICLAIRITPSLTSKEDGRHGARGALGASISDQAAVWADVTGKAAAR
jgi:hypothetical protein